MKKTFSFIFLFIATNFMFSQNASVKNIMEINGSADIFFKLIESTLPNISKEKQVDFKAKAEKLAETKKNEAQKYFEKKYPQKDIDLIYSELKQEDRLSYSDRTTEFLQEWRLFKTEFQTDFKKLYNSFNQ